MISQRASGFNAVLVGAQLAIASGVYWLLVLAFGQFYRGGLVSENSYAVYWLLALGGLLFEAIARRQQGDPFVDQFVRLHLRSFRQVGYAALPIVLYLVAAKDRGLSRLFLFALLPTLYCTLVASGAFLPRFIAGQLFRGRRRERTLLIGNVEQAEMLRPWLDGKAYLGVEVVGLVLSDGPEHAPAALVRLCDTPFPPSPQERRYEVLGTVESLPQLVREYEITQVIRTGLPARGQTFDSHIELMGTCEALGVRLLTVSDVERLWGRALTFIEDAGVRLIALREEPLENPVNQAVKRAIDVAFSLPIILCVLPPTALLVWLFQRLQSPGPLFHRQVRAGYQNRQFQILKFRTMRADHGEMVRQATANDDRVYPAARFFRKWSIDEIPQFWNVLSGEMSLVGPRPHLVEHNAQFAQQLAQYHVRTFVKPGITGLAQVRGFRGEARDNRDIANRVTSDIEYLENWRLSLEFAIILRTFLHLLRPPKTAY